ncbi:Kelch repeat-containing protein [Maricurvus nonylphenolicus]|uniref:Kelch repeat-containing protein n=1 Tax=Maricurvus nonylphenolicus TaxID=1008307 RepID=UPI0036F3C03E
MAALINYPHTVKALETNSTEKWQSAQALPLRLQEIYPAAHNGRLYIAGGIAARWGIPYFTNRCISYDPVEDSWREEAELPENLHHAALVSTGERLFLIGGFNGAYTHIWKMRSSVYELTESGWQPCGHLPQPQAEGVVSKAPDGSVHIVTGQSPLGQANSSRTDHREVKHHYRWDVDNQKQTAQWQQLAPIPTARNSATGGWVDNQLIITGGRTAQGNLSATEIYDPDDDRWRKASPLPLPQAGLASVTVNDGIIVFGGEMFTPKEQVFGNVWRYSLSQDRWTSLPSLPTPRHGLGAVRFNNRIHVVGGATNPSGSGTSDVNEVLIL